MVSLNPPLEANYLYIFHGEMYEKSCIMLKTKAEAIRTTVVPIIRDYHMGILVIARSINPRLHYQAREL